MVLNRALSVFGLAVVGALAGCAGETSTPDTDTAAGTAGEAAEENVGQTSQALTAALAPNAPNIQEAACISSIVKAIFGNGTAVFNGVTHPLQSGACASVRTKVQNGTYPVTNDGLIYSYWSSGPAVSTVYYHIRSNTTIAQNNGIRNPDMDACQSEAVTYCGGMVHDVNHDGATAFFQPGTSSVSPYDAAHTWPELWVDPLPATLTANLSGSYGSSAAATDLNGPTTMTTWYSSGAANSTYSTSVACQTSTAGQLSGYQSTLSLKKFGSVWACQ